MAQIILRHGVSCCFGTKLAPTRRVNNAISPRPFF